MAGVDRVYPAAAGGVLVSGISSNWVAGTITTVVPPGALPAINLTGLVAVAEETFTSALDATEEMQFTVTVNGTVRGVIPIVLFRADTAVGPVPTNIVRLPEGMPIPAGAHIQLTGAGHAFASQQPDARVKLLYQVADDTVPGQSRVWPAAGAGVVVTSGAVGVYGPTVELVPSGFLPQVKVTGFLAVLEGTIGPDLTESAEFSVLVNGTEKLVFSDTWRWDDATGPYRGAQLVGFPEPHIVGAGLPVTARVRYTTGTGWTFRLKMLYEVVTAGTTVVADAATATTSSSAPVVATRVMSPVATGTAPAVTPAVTARASTTPAVATASSQAPVAVTQAASPAAMATAAGLVPTFAGQTTVPAATATASATGPVAGVVVVVSSEGATATAVGPIVPPADFTAIVPAATASATAGAPAISSTAESDAAAGTATAGPPVVDVLVTGTSGDATATFPVPALPVAEVTVAVPAATATASAAPPAAATVVLPPATQATTSSGATSQVTVIVPAAVATASAPVFGVVGEAPPIGSVESSTVLVGSVEAASALQGTEGHSVLVASVEDTSGAQWTEGRSSVLIYE